MIRIKLTIRNILHKPLRTVAVVIALAAAAFAALFCISGVNSARNRTQDFFSSSYGNADMIAMNGGKILEFKEEDISKEGSYVGTYAAYISYTMRDPEFYNYLSTEIIQFQGVDTKKAAEMKLLSEAYPTEKDGVTMTIPLAARLGLKEGDTLTIYGDEGKEYNLKILKLIAPERFLRSNPMVVLATPELTAEISGTKQGYSMMFFDIPEEKQDIFFSELKEKYPDYIIFGTMDDEGASFMNSMLNVYYLIFAVVVMMVCFIVASLSKHIANERMPLVGMLRSVGGSVGSTGAMLLLESVGYGLIGAVLGTLLYLPMRNMAALDLFFGSDQVEKSDGITPLSVILVIIAVVLVECLFSSSALLKASRTSIRDIIFGTKETAFFPSKVKTIVGGVLLALGLASYFLSEEFLLSLVSAGLTAVGMVMFFPWVLSMLAKLLHLLFDKLHCPTAKLAAVEASTKKSSVSTAQLIVSALSLTIAVLVLTVSVIQFYSGDTYDSDLILIGMSDSIENYSYLRSVDGVQEMEPLYYEVLMYGDYAIINGNPQSMYVMAQNDGGFRQFKGVSGLPVSIGSHEAVMDEELARRIGLSIGDEFHIVLKKDLIIPRELDLKLVSYCDSRYFNNLGTTLVLSEEDYHYVYGSTPKDLLIRTAPEKKEQVYDLVLRTKFDGSMTVQTIEEYRAEFMANVSSILSILYAVAVIGLLLSLLGTASNLLISFEQSRRKYAVYYSTAMSRAKLKKLILLETLFTAGFSAAAAVVFGLYFLQIIEKALTLMEITVPVVNGGLYAVLFGLASALLLMVTCLRPIRELSKMDMAQEIKTSAD